MRAAFPPIKLITLYRSSTTNKLNMYLYKLDNGLVVPICPPDKGSQS
jgi:hypothetical protein